MSNQFTKIAFTDSVKDVQQLMGSRKMYAHYEDAGKSNHLLTKNEIEFLNERDSFYIATVSETDWPYVQHRGGPKGFIKILSENQIGFADFSGNKQYVSVGNLTKNNKVALILVDYPNQARMKILGHVRIVDAKSEPDLLSKLTPENYKAKIERGFVITISGYDWNCPQHITPRWTADEIKEATLPLTNRIAELEKTLRELQK